MPHPLFALFAATLLATALAADRRPLGTRVYVALRTLAGCALAVAGLGWLMYLIHG